MANEHADQRAFKSRQAFVVSGSIASARKSEPIFAKHDAWIKSVGASFCTSKRTRRFNEMSRRRVMMTIFVRTAAALAVASVTLAFSGQSHATVFAAWQVSNVPFGDTLNVRKYPSGTSQKQAAYPNGTVLQMTGRCTGGINLLDIANQPGWKQQQKIRYRWCEVWHDPAKNGHFVTGWIYGKYISPY